MICKIGAYNKLVDIISDIIHLVELCHKFLKNWIEGHKGGNF